MGNEKKEGYVTPMVKHPLQSVELEIRAKNLATRYLDERFGTGKYKPEELGLVWRHMSYALAASPPTLNTGMGEPIAWMTKEQDPPEFVPAWVQDAWVKGGGPISEYFIPRYPTPLYANIHTKVVTVESIVKLAEEWNAYCVVTPTDPDGIEDFRARLLKLTQQ